MVPLKVVQHVSGVEVGGPAVLADCPRAVTGSIQPRLGADVDHLDPRCSVASSPPKCRSTYRMLV